MQKIIFLILCACCVSKSFAQSYLNKGLELTYLVPNDDNVSGSKIRLGYSNLKNFGVAAIIDNTIFENGAVLGIGGELNYNKIIWKNLNANIIGRASLLNYEGKLITKGDGLRWSLGANLYYRIPVVKNLFVQPIIGYTYQSTNSTITYSNNQKIESTTLLSIFNYGASLAFNIKKFSIGVVPMFTAYDDNNDFGLTIGAGYFF